MRRKDREITDINEIISMLKEFQVCNLAFNDKDYPYVIPLNFGYKAEGDSVKLYFHGANEGKKIDLINTDNKAAFSMYKVDEFAIYNEASKSTTMYKSVCGRGRIRFIDDYDEKIEAFKAIMANYCEGDDFVYNENAVKHTCVYELIAEDISGKKH